MRLEKNDLQFSSLSTRVDMQDIYISKTAFDLGADFPLQKKSSFSCERSRNIVSVTVTLVKTNNLFFNLQKLLKKLNLIFY